MKYSVIVAVLLGVTWGIARAVPPHEHSSHAAVSRVRQPAGAPTKPSSFAPHQLHTHVFGAPIQPPILFRKSARRDGPKD